MENYFTKQIITYMGNKRKLLPHIEQIIEELEKKEGKKLTMGDGFSGSGIVSRLFKKHGKFLYTNDMAMYSEILNRCYLANISDEEVPIIQKYITTANRHADRKTKKYNIPYVSGNWAPKEETIDNHRTYFTKENGERIDIIRNYIDTLPEKYRPFLLGTLIVECSIHNNTNGQFSAYYKNESGMGQYGGKHSIDLRRITQPIKVQFPVTQNNTCDYSVSRMDTNEWVKSIPQVDLMYYDPPYNKHPYSIYYFLLDIIASWDKEVDIPNTNRGQPTGWSKSLYNSSRHAETSFVNLMENTKAKYVLISYNSGGIISLSKMDNILSRFGNVTKIPVEHKTYNRLKGISDYKRQKEKSSIKEYFWLIEMKQ